MITVGLTGGIGMGKSTAATLLSGLEIPVIDTDSVARQVVEPGQIALSEVKGFFGADIVGPDGQLRRDELAKRVFSNPDARKRLEGILHPRIREVWRAQVQRWREEERPLGAVVVPLLFEVAAAKEFDAVVCVACSAATQLDRLRARGWTDEQIAQRMEAQWPIDQKIARSDFVVWSEGVLDVHLAQLKRILADLHSDLPELNT